MPEEPPKIFVPKKGHGKSGYSAESLRAQAKAPASEFETPKTEAPKPIEIKDKEVKDLTFQETLKEESRLVGIEDNDPASFPQADALRLHAVRAKTTEHIAKADEAGELDRINERTAALEEEVERLKQAGSVPLSVHTDLRTLLLNEGQRAMGYDNPDEEEERKGVGHHVYNQEISRLLRELHTITPAEPAQAGPSRGETQSGRVHEGIPYIEPRENNSGSWTHAIFEGIKRAELKSEEKNQKSDDLEEHWEAIEYALERLQSDPNYEAELKGERDDVLSYLLREKYKDGVYLKEKLEIYFEARRRLNDRYVEVKRSNGNLTALGVGAEDVPYEGIAYKKENINPVDWYVLFHSDELFANEAAAVNNQQERKEITPNVDEAMCDWFKVGMAYGDKADGFNDAPSLKDSYNSVDAMARLRGKLREKLEAQGISEDAELIAWRLLHASRAIQLFDRDRRDVGEDQDRDLMHFDTGRLQNYMEKGRAQGIEWTVGRYFPLQNQADLELQDSKRRDPEIVARRKRIITRNAEKSVFPATEGFYGGQLIGDFFQKTVSVPDGLQENKLIQRKMISYVLDKKGNVKRGGWKKIPFYLLDPLTYGSYFSYDMNIANAIGSELKGGVHKPEDMANPNLWERQITLFERMSGISPWFNSVEYDFRGEYMRGMLETARDEWGFDELFDQEKIDKISGYSDETDIKQFSEEEQLVILGLLEDESLKTWMADGAKGKAQDYVKENLNELSYVHSTGAIWSGSFDRLHATARWGDPSIITSNQLMRIYSAMMQGGYLEKSDITNLMHEADQMGFGRAKWLHQRKN